MFVNGISIGPSERQKSMETIAVGTVGETAIDLGTNRREPVPPGATPDAGAKPHTLPGAGRPSRSMRAHDKRAERRLIPRWMTVEGLLACTLALNVADLSATLYFVEQGYATEANPFLASVLAASPAAFVLVKSSMVVSGLAVLYRHRGRALARAGTMVVSASYALITTYHLYGASLLLAGLLHS